MISMYCNINLTDAWLLRAFQRSMKFCDPQLWQLPLQERHSWYQRKASSAIKKRLTSIRMIKMIFSSLKRQRKDNKGENIESKTYRAYWKWTCAIRSRMCFVTHLVFSTSLLRWWEILRLRKYLSRNLDGTKKKQYSTTRSSAHQPLLASHLAAFLVVIWSKLAGAKRPS